ncbi:MAG: hypothetical protein CEE41_04385 [Hadesarchaea archaeon B3_Hades]|nr:MAG: hypothetical protein CEE41_04385 [Hadesarchaea archaeon B3_Hades]
MEGVQDWFDGLWDWISEAAVNAVSVVSDWIWGAIEWLNDEIGELFTWVGQRIGDLYDDVVLVLTEGWKGLTEAIESIAPGVLEGVGDALAGVGDVVAGIGEGLDEIISSIGDTVKSGLEVLGDAYEVTSAWIGDTIGTSIFTLTTTVTGFVADALKGGMDWVSSAMAGVAGAIGDGLKGLFSWIMESLQNLATGIAGAMAGIRGAVEPVFTGIAGGIMSALTSAIQVGSPDEEIDKSVKEFTDTYMKRMMELAKFEEGSVPTLATLLPRAAGVITANLGAAVMGQAVGAALDLAHPVKNMGMRMIAMDVVNSIQMPAMIGPLMMGPIWAGLIVPLRYRFNELNPTAVPGPRELTDMITRGTISEAEYRQAQKFHALDDSWASAMMAAAYRTPGFPDLQLMYWRGEIGEADVGAALVRQGMAPDLIAPYLKIMERVPGPGDLVRMAVREAFRVRPGDEEISSTFIAKMGLQGYVEEAVYWFWRAHWVLPSVGQVFDMYHRGIAMPMSVTEYLKWADYAPEWRAPLEELSWDLPGRIDARWMFRWGDIDVDELQDLLEKRGLDPDWSGRVASATAKNQWLTEINRLRDNAKRRFVRGYDLEDQLRANLAGLGYPETWIEFHVRDAIEDGEMELKDDMVRALGDGYLKDLVTEDALEISLKAIIVRPRIVQMEMERLYIRKYRKPKEPTPAKVPVVPLSTLKRAFRDGLITESDFRAELEARGYGPVDIDMLAAIEMATIAEEMVEMPAKVRVATLGTLRMAFREGVISESELISELEARDYGADDIDLIIAVEKTRMEEEAE